MLENCFGQFLMILNVMLAYIVWLPSVFENEVCSTTCIVYISKIVRNDSCWYSLEVTVLAAQGSRV